MPTFRFAGMNTTAKPAAIDCFNPKSRQYGQCVDIVNCDLDEEHIATRRRGSLRVAEGDVTATWSDGIKAYCVTGGRLCSFDGTVLTVLSTTVSVLAECEFAAVNDVVVFSDTVVCGVIEGAVVTRIDNADDWAGVEDLAAWVASHYPADFQADASNFGVDAFKLSARPGSCLCTFNGALYYAIDNYVYCTKTFDVEHEDIRANVVAGYADPVTMIAPVADGLYIGTTTATYFLSGGGFVLDDKTGVVTGGFTQRQVAGWGPIRGTAVPVDTKYLPVLQAIDLAVLWATPMGICAGVNGGAVVNLSAGKITLSSAARGNALFFDNDGVYQYRVCLTGETWVLNTITLTHCRHLYAGITNLFGLGDACYAGSSRGLYRLTGDKDFAGEVDEADIDAYILTPASTCGQKTLINVNHAYVNSECADTMALDLFVNQTLAAEDYRLDFYIENGMHRGGAKLPRGIRGNTWQFRIKNVAGCDFTISGLEPVVNAATKRTH